ncbi:unnamed protein product [Gadus morhua 'NCC']
MALLNDERVGLTVLLITMAHYGMCMSVHYPGMGRVLPSQDCLSLVISGCAQNLCSLFQGLAGVLGPVSTPPHLLTAPVSRRLAHWRSLCKRPQVFKTLLITNTKQPEKSSVHCASPLELSLAAVLFLVALH